MAFRPSVVFLFDTEFFFDGKPKQPFTSESINVTSTDFLRRVTYTILHNFHDNQTGAQWGYRFYTSSTFRLTNKTRFFELSSQSLDDFEESLNLNFELKSNVSRDFSNHKMSKASVLNRALQDIISDYDWKTPSDSLTPTRKGRRTGKVVQVMNQNQNFVFIFTAIPTDEMLQEFCQLKSESDVNLKSVTDAIFSKDLVKRFQEFNITLNFVDFSEHQKYIFSQLINSISGAVLQAETLVSPFSFQHVLSASFSQNKTSKEIVKCCQDLVSTFNISVSYSSNLYLDFESYCWNSFCLQSSTSKQIEMAVTPCPKSVGSCLSSFDFLAYSSSCFLTSNKPIPHIFQNYLWVGIWNQYFCTIIPLSCHLASMFIFSDSNWLGQINFLLNKPSNILQDGEVNDDGDVKDFIEQIINEDDFVSKDIDFPPSPSQIQEPYDKLDILKSNFVETKRRFSSYHWELLRDCFENDRVDSEVPSEQAYHCLEQLQVQPTISGDLLNSSNEVLIKKISNSRGINLRASTLLLKSQEIRAKHDEQEREKSSREQKYLIEKKEKALREQQAYMDSMRDSIFPKYQFIKMTSDIWQYPKNTILERCVFLKAEGLRSQPEDNQIQSLSQVIISTILYVWKETSSMNTAFEIIENNFLRKPGFINRSIPKESKTFEFKFQIFFRLELLWMVPSLVGNEEEVLQEVIPLFQMLSIHSSPQTMALFYQDTIINNYGFMVPEFLVTLGEELNQPIPSLLNDLIESKTDSSLSSPAASCKAPSVLSVASHQEVQDVKKDARTRTLTRHSSFNVLQHRKQIALPTKKEERSSLPVKREDFGEVVRVRRSLQFGADLPSSAELFPNEPSKFLDRSHEFTTPSKSDKLVLAPETPSRLRSGNKSNRKSDGVFVVSESPDIKSENLRRSPRRLEAAIALRRRASFYSSLTSDPNVEKTSSRNWAKAESQVWSEKAKASASIPTSFEDNNNANPNQSARFLFSKILSCTDSLYNVEPLENSSGNCLNADTKSNFVSLTTPRKVDLIPTTPSRRQLENPVSDEIKSIAGTPLKTPLKTPKHVQFNLIHQPATPSSKIVLEARSILKSPNMLASPGPKKFKMNDSSNQLQSLLISDQNMEVLNSNEVSTENPLTHVLNDAEQAQELKVLKSSSKSHKKTVVSPLVLRRSPRHRDQVTNFYNHNPNWSVVSYRRLNTSRAERTFQSPERSKDKEISSVDPYEFEESAEAKPNRLNANDLTSHKRKLFQSTSESPLSKRGRFSSPSAIVSSKSTFATPSESSLFHLEHSPLVQKKCSKMSF